MEREYSFISNTIIPADTLPSPDALQSIYFMCIQALTGVADHGQILSAASGSKRCPLFPGHAAKETYALWP